MFPVVLKVLVVRCDDGMLGSADCIFEAISFSNESQKARVYDQFPGRAVAMERSENMVRCKTVALTTRSFCAGAPLETRISSLSPQTQRDGNL